jgi:hypothetical protein
MLYVKLWLLLVICASPLSEAVQKKDLRSDLADARHKWEERKPSSYEFTVVVRCFCGGMPNTGATFRVVDGQPVALTTLTGEVQKLYSSFNTVEKLFAAIDRSLSRGQFNSTVKYDEELGFPVSADLDPQRLVKDEELYLRVSGFRAIGR